MGLQAEAGSICTNSPLVAVITTGFRQPSGLILPHSCPPEGPEPPSSWTQCGYALVVPGSCILPFLRNPSFRHWPLVADISTFTISPPLSPFHLPFHHFTFHFTISPPHSPFHLPFHHFTSSFTISPPLSPFHLPFHHFTSTFTSPFTFLPFFLLSFLLPSFS